MAKAAYDYTGSVVLVTGAGSGIGLACAQAFAAAGASVAISDRDESTLAEAVEGVRNQGGTAEAFTLDVRSEDKVADVVKKVSDRFGKLDIALNNAGIPGRNTPLSQLDGDSWKNLIETNLSSVFYCMKAELGLMLEAGKGAIINTASITSVSAAYNMPEYVAAKHGVLGLTRAAALENASRGIRVNAICPGIVATPMLDNLPPAVLEGLERVAPMARLATTEEVADAVLWLASDSASFVTGQGLLIDGGASLGGEGSRPPGG